MPNTIAATVAAAPAAPTTANTAASPTRPERPSSSARTPPRIAKPKAAGTPIPAASEAQTTVRRASVSTIVGDHALDAAGATGPPWRARRENSTAEPPTMSADTITGPAAPVPNARVTP